MVKAPTTDMIIKCTSRQLGIPTDVMLDTSNKSRQVVYARHIAMFLSRELAFKSYYKLATEFGCTHGAVAYGCAQIDKTNEANKYNISKITKALKHN